MILDRKGLWKGSGFCNDPGYVGERTIMGVVGEKDGRQGLDVEPHSSKASLGRRPVAVSETAPGTPARKTIGVRWRWVLLWAALVSLSTYALGLLLVSTGVDLLSFMERQGWAELDLEDYTSLGRLVGAVGWPAIYLVLTVGAALWVGRRVVVAAPLQGVLIGLVSTFLIQGVSLLFGPLIPREFLLYLCLGVAGGFLGGRRGWAARAGEEALYETSRAVSVARNPREIAAAIGENLAGTEVNGITLWETELQPGKDKFSLMGFWSPWPERQWPPGTQIDAAWMPPALDLEDSTSLELRTADLPPAGREAWEREGARSLLLIPLVPPNGASRGLLVISSRRKRGFSRGAIRAYLTTSGPAALALENVRLLERARSSGRKAGMLGERQRLAREIHDTLAQGFTSIVMNLEAAEGALPDEVSEETRTKWHLDQARFTARESLTEARRLVWALRPESLDNASLPEALAQLAARWSDSAGVEATATLTGTPRPLSAEAEVTLVRVAQEALANVLKHASAGRVVLTLSYMGDRVSLDVIDDGEGFDTNRTGAAAPERGFGLRTMRERVEQLGGNLTVESAPGEGTTLVAELPVSAAERTPESVRETQ